MKGIGLYIHIPFCKQKCLYCDFPSFSGKEDCMISYAKALAKEIDNMDKYEINTIFIGGGTPTYLSLEAWQFIQKSIDKLHKAPNCEFSIEANPATFEKNKLLFFKELGVNRLSIGLQAWQNSLLRSIGRIHSDLDFVEGFSVAREVGFENINVDLMFGLPDQTLKDWRETLEKVTFLEPEHLSCYGLIIEENTPLHKKYIDNLLNLPTEEMERDMYKETTEFLKTRGYEQYEISNFSKCGKECKHNLAYWELKEYVGVGAGAHSYVNGNRYRNEETVEEYIRKMDVENSANIEIHENLIKDDIEEFMFMGLRKIKGISTLDFEKRFNVKMDTIYKDVIEKYKKQGLLLQEEQWLRFSSRGVEVSNFILSDFILDK